MSDEGVGVTHWEVVLHRRVTQECRMVVEAPSEREANFAAIIEAVAWMDVDVGPPGVGSYKPTVRHPDVSWSDVVEDVAEFLRGPGT